MRDVEAVRIQQEPFYPKGDRANEFEADRFAERLRHVEITFEDLIEGPLVIGDGRFLGLGLMRPVRTPSKGIYLFAMGPALADPTLGDTVARQLRRAVMARAQSQRRPGGDLPRLFHGHEADGSPSRSGRHEHLFFVAFGAQAGDSLNRIAVLAPHACDRTNAPSNTPDLTAALAELRTLRCGKNRLFSLSSVSWESQQDIFGVGRLWRSETAYQPTRHPKRRDVVNEFLEADIRAELARRALPFPIRVTVNQYETGPQGGVWAWLEMEFRKGICGPILIGQNSHFGSGLFRKIE